MLYPLVVHHLLVILSVASAVHTCVEADFYVPVSVDSHDEGYELVAAYLRLAY